MKLQISLAPDFGEIIQYIGGLRHLSTIPLKNSYIFKFVKSTYDKKKKKILLGRPNNFKQVRVF